jgi:hypothetical protein
VSRRSRAALTLLVLGATGLAALGVPSRATVPAATADAGDVATFRAMVTRLRAGEPYYAAFGEELRRGHYSTSEVFNWRTPLFMSGLSLVPDTVSYSVLVVLGLVLCGATLVSTNTEPVAVRWAAFTMQVGVLILLMNRRSVVMSEAWAGVLIGLSVCGYSLRQPGFAVPLGLLALFVRELAAPYCVVCTIAAAFNRRWREVGAWLIGGCLYAGYYGWHLTRVFAHRLPTDLSDPSSWFQMGGLASLMATARWNGWLVLTPRTATALALALIVGGIFYARAPLHVRLASAIYVAFFLVAGKVFNGYWGLIAWPTWALACGYGVEAAAQSISALFQRSLRSPINSSASFPPQP